jgi:isoleucyl-tRNA synthetase
VAITASGSIAALLEQHRAYLPMLFIVSNVALHVTTTDGPDSVSIQIDKAPGVRCDRCWRFVPKIHTEADWAGLCDRCVDALAEPVSR